MDTNLSLNDYLTMIADRANYKERCEDAIDAGKGVFLATMCPRCYLQQPTESVNTSPEHKYCECDDRPMLPDDILIAALADPSWSVRLGAARSSTQNW